MSMETQLNKDSTIDFWEGVDNLLSNIKKDYAKWSNRAEGIERFNKNLDVKSGRKYTKIIQNKSVWGFIANGDGMLKGIPYFKGDVFMAASWSAPARHVRVLSLIRKLIGLVGQARTTDEKKMYQM